MLLVPAPIHGEHFVPRHRRLQTGYRRGAHPTCCPEIPKSQAPVVADGGHRVRLLAVEAGRAHGAIVRLRHLEEWVGGDLRRHLYVPNAEAAAVVARGKQPPIGRAPLESESVRGLALWHQRGVGTDDSGRTLCLVVEEEHGARGRLRRQQLRHARARRNPVHLRGVRQAGGHAERALGARGGAAAEGLDAAQARHLPGLPRVGVQLRHCAATELRDDHLVGHAAVRVQPKGQPRALLRVVRKPRDGKRGPLQRAADEEVVEQRRVDRPGHAVLEILVALVLPRQTRRRLFITIPAVAWGGTGAGSAGV
mmetsp:Transcript_9323/g.23187  ORF Transcript_9323/g.23187 Transcript_9323/m.23187 type:complete len:309 (+) Transcript_9323:410-1336(+)